METITLNLQTKEVLIDMLNVALEELMDFVLLMDINSALYHDTRHHVAAVSMAVAMLQGENYTDRRRNSSVKVLVRATQWLRALRWCPHELE